MERWLIGEGGEFCFDVLLNWLVKCGRLVKKGQGKAIMQTQTDVMYVCGSAVGMMEDSFFDRTRSREALEETSIEGRHRDTETQTPPHTPTPTHRHTHTHTQKQKQKTHHAEHVGQGKAHHGQARNGLGGRQFLRAYALLEEADNAERCGRVRLEEGHELAQRRARVDHVLDEDDVPRGQCGREVRAFDLDL